MGVNIQTKKGQVSHIIDKVFRPGIIIRLIMMECYRRVFLCVLECMYAGVFMSWSVCVYVPLCAYVRVGLCVYNTLSVSMCVCEFVYVLMCLSLPTCLAKNV